MTSKFAADAFYNGELEAELRRIGKHDLPFLKDSDRENHMEVVESIRRESLYLHPPSECSSACKDRGDIILFNLKVILTCACVSIVS